MELYNSSKEVGGGELHDAPFRYPVRPRKPDATPSSIVGESPQTTNRKLYLLPYFLMSIQQQVRETTHSCY